MSIRRVIALIGNVAVFAALLSTHRVAFASVPDAWKSTQYLVAAGDTTLEQVFADFRRLTSIPVDLTEGVRGPTASSGVPMSIDGMLDALSARHGLSWFVFRNHLYVSLQSESREVRLKVLSTRMPELRAYLAGIKLLDDRFTWIEVASRDEVVVQGPPAYVALVKENADSVKPLEPALASTPPPEPRVVMTFRLKYASAADDVSGRPGVASLLSRLFGGAMGGISATGDLHSLTLEAIRRNGDWDRRVRAVGRAASGNDAALVVQRELARGPGAGGTDGASAGIPVDGAGQDRRSEARSDAPTFEAEPRLNMVIVRDKASRRAEYERVIASLDVLTEQIALDATVIELPATAMSHALDTISSVSSPTALKSGSPALIAPRRVVERTFEQVSRARRKDGSATILTQGLVFSEDDPFSLDFADSRALPQYSTTIWQALASSLVPMKVSSADGERRIGIKMAGSAKYIAGHGVALKLEMSEDRNIPEKKSKSTNGRSTSASMSVELREDQVLILTNSSVWSGEDMAEPRGRVILLSAQRWQARNASSVMSPGPTSSAVGAGDVGAAASGAATPRPLRPTAPTSRAAEVGDAR